MPDVLDEYGLQVKSLAEIRDELEASLKTIYGEDINVEQNTPDGQLIGILSQAASDIRELIVKTFAGLDPEQAEPVNLIGLDNNVNDIKGIGYTIQDEEGNEFILTKSVSLDEAATYTLLFRARELGMTAVLPNTLTIPVTVISGVVSVNNRESPLTIGQDEESDFQLRRRRAKLFSISGEGYIDNIISVINAIEKVTSAVVLENTGSTPDINGIPAHGIWAIVEGGADSDIAMAIYEKRPAGIPMKGDVSVELPVRGGRTKTIYFDRPQYRDIYLTFNLRMKNNGKLNADWVKNKIVESVVFEVGKGAFAGELTAFVLSLNNNYVVTNMRLSLDNNSWREYLYPDSPRDKFLLDIGRITIE